MMSPNTETVKAAPGRRPAAARLAGAALVLLAISGCRPGSDETRVAGWAMVDPTQRHPIMVSQQPTSLAVRVARGSYGLSPHQRAQVASFLEKYRGIGAANSRLVIQAPSGTPNEVSAMQAVAEIRHLITDMGFDPSAITVEPYHDERDPQAPVRVSYARYVAEGPDCGRWPSNMAETESNLNYPNLGCANQRNFAAMVANPADLVGPRGMGPVSGERRDTIWNKYIKGESTVTQKQEDEKVKVQGNR